MPHNVVPILRYLKFVRSGQSSQARSQIIIPPEISTVDNFRVCGKATAALRVFRKLCK